MDVSTGFNHLVSGECGGNRPVEVAGDLLPLSSIRFADRRLGSLVLHLLSQLLGRSQLCPVAVWQCADHGGSLGSQLVVVVVAF